MERVRLAAMIPTWDVDMAIAEVRRVAGNPSVGGLLVPLVGTPEWNLPVWEPLWAVIQETGMPAVMHQGSGQGRADNVRLVPPPAIGRTEVDAHNAIAILLMR